MSKETPHAFAGKTRKRLRPDLRMKKHPRLHRDYLYMLCAYHPLIETPPRTLGRFVADRITEPDEGNTPANAGKTRAGELELTQLRKHPRERWEDDFCSALLAFTIETPPRVRGDQNVCDSTRGAFETLPKIREIRNTRVNICCVMETPRQRGKDLACSGVENRM